MLDRLGLDGRGRPANVSGESGTGLKYQVERRFRCSPKVRKSTGSNHFAQAGFPRLGTQTQSNFLREGCWNANEGRRRIVNPTHRIQIGRDIVIRKRFNHHPRAIRRKGLADVSCRSRRIAHIVETIKKSHEIVALARKLLGWRHLKGHPIGHACGFGFLAGSFDRGGMIIKAEKARLRVRLRHENGGRAMATSDIGDFRSVLEFFVHPVERRYPTRR